MLFLFNVFAKCRCKLIGARGALESATDSAQTIDSIRYRHSNEQCRNPLCVSCASTVEVYLLDDIVFDINLNYAGAYAARLIS